MQVTDIGECGMEGWGDVGLGLGGQGGRFVSLEIQERIPRSTHTKISGGAAAMAVVDS